MVSIGRDGKMITTKSASRVKKFVNAEKRMRGLKSQKARANRANVKAYCHNVALDVESADSLIPAFKQVSSWDIA